MVSGAMSAPQRRRSDELKPANRIRKAERKRQLLQHAKQLFATLGYPNTTTEQIAAAAAVSEPVVHRHFANKQELFQEIVREVGAVTLGRWRTETAGVADPLARLHAIAELYVGATREHALEFRVVHRALVETEDEAIVACLRAFYLECEALLTDIISQGQQAGVFRRSLDPRVGAWELIRSALGYTLTASLAIPLYQQVEFFPQAIDCLLHCLLKTDV
jgi:AcrR family transcriptional regulator